LRGTSGVRLSLATMSVSQCRPDRKRLTTTAKRMLERHVLNVMNEQEVGAGAGFDPGQSRHAVAGLD
ncbi:MAG: hypothetical protein KDJ22_17435, partial [Candidatus Competibacteraceae bacterium]|nr:hypothetical protein [Candidatus Competibacteraceae bacterium]